VLRGAVAVWYTAAISGTLAAVAHEDGRHGAGGTAAPPRRY